MTQKKRIVNLFILVLLPALVLAADPDSVGARTSDVSFRATANITLHDCPVTFTDENTENLENTLSIRYVSLGLEMDVMDYLTVGSFAGFNSNHFKQGVNATGLPLSLQLGDEKNNSMIFGLTARSEITSMGDFTLVAEGMFTLFKMHENHFSIVLPIVNGEAQIENSFKRAHVQALIQYDGLSTFNLYAGPRLHLLKGKIKASEMIETIEAEQTMNYKQAHLLGLVCGADYDPGNHLTFSFQAAFIAETSVTLKAIYEF